MKTFLTLALTLVLTAACLVGCGCTNQNMEDTSAPTVLPTNEEIWNNTETSTHSTTGESMTTETTNEGTNGGTNGGANGGTNGGTNGGSNGAATESTDTSRSVNETEIRNHVNAYSDMVQEQMKKDKEGNNSSSRMMPGTR